MDTLVLQLEANAIDMILPLFLVARLRTNLNRVLVLVVVSEERVDTELVLEAHREGLILIGEVNEDVFLGLLGQLHEVLLEILGLRLLDHLRHHGHGDLELLLLHVHRVVLQLYDTQSLEGWVAWAGQFDTREYLWSKGLSADILVVSVECQLGLVAWQALHLRQRAG